MKPEGSVVSSWRALKVSVRTLFSALRVTWQMTGRLGERGET